MAHTGKLPNLYIDYHPVLDAGQDKKREMDDMRRRFHAVGEKSHQNVYLLSFRNNSEARQVHTPSLNTDDVDRAMAT